MNTVALRKNAASLVRLAGKKANTTTERTLEINLNALEHVSREVRHLRHSARDLRRQIPAFDEQIVNRRRRTKQWMSVADTLHSTLFAMGAATAVAGGATSKHIWLLMGSWGMVSGVAGAVLAGMVATLWELATQGLIRRRATLLNRASRYETMAHAMDPSRHPPAPSATACVAVVSGEGHRPAVVS